ncbi:hypothetical protein AOLI_G00054180 [Acnodon oligacanthus]
MGFIHGSPRVPLEEVWPEQLQPPYCSLMPQISLVCHSDTGMISLVKQPKGHHPAPYIHQALSSFLNWQKNHSCPSPMLSTPKKATTFFCSLLISSSGGSKTIILCHNVEAAKLFATSTLPLYDNRGNSQFHLDNQANTFFVIPSQFFC